MNQAIHFKTPIKFKPDKKLFQEKISRLICITLGSLFSLMFSMFLIKLINSFN